MANYDVAAAAAAAAVDVASENPSRYELLYTPHVANLNLWKTSGHFDFYKEGMFDQMDVEGDEYQIKPMNCPFHCLVYKNDLRSYRCEIDSLPQWLETHGRVYCFTEAPPAIVGKPLGGLRPGCRGRYFASGQLESNVEACAGQKPSRWFSLSLSATTWLLFCCRDWRVFGPRRDNGACPFCSFSGRFFCDVPPGRV